MTTQTFKEELDYLTSALDSMVEEQAGKKLHDSIDAIRELALSGRRDGNRRSLQKKRSLLASLSVEDAYQIAHAYSLFFQLVNLCEERERVRRLSMKEAPAMSMDWLFATLKQSKVKPKTVQKCLDSLEIEPVLTAHPTETKRRTTMNQLSRLVTNWDHPEESMEALWMTEEVRQQKMSPLNEVDNALFYFQQTIFEGTANFYRRFCEGLEKHYPTVKLSRSFLRFASWVGGDRDGNPFVTPEVSLEAMERHRDRALKHYYDECRLLVNETTQADPVAEVGGADPVFGAHGKQFQPFESLRGQLAALAERIHNRSISAEGLLAGLESVQRSLIERGAVRSAKGRIQSLIQKVKVFGFHLAELDFRDNSTKLTTARGELLEEFKTIRELQRIYGPDAAHRFILSMTMSAEHILVLFEIAQEAKCLDVDLVPLFETIGDLENSVGILRQLWDDKDYRQHLKRRGNIQEVMVGYSDSNKDGGYLAANWHLHEAQRRMTELADELGMKLRFFHGKGGTIDRGGGASHRSLRAQPNAAPGGRLRITEQGEVVSLKYSRPEIAKRNFEQLASAVIAGQCLPFEEKEEKRIPVWEGVMKELSDLSFTHYQDLVFRTPGFIDYFWQATPIELVEHLNIGSRPVKRASNAGRDITQLRAIPWVMSWTQSRHLISAWYGIGHAVTAYCKKNPKGLAELRQMYRDWPFFQQLIENAEISLAKTELGIAREYAQLVKDESLRNRIFKLIEKEYAKSVDAILKITKHKRLLENQPTLEESLHRRNPEIDPLNYLQIQFIRQWRKTPPKKRTETLRRLLVLTVKALSFGMKSTG